MPSTVIKSKRQRGQRGRPSKVEAAATEEISKRKRGRPSKVEAAATEEITTRKRGRPPIDECRSTNSIREDPVNRYIDKVCSFFIMQILSYLIHVLIRF